MDKKSYFSKLELSLIKMGGRNCPECKNWVDKKYINPNNKKCNLYNNEIDFNTIPSNHLEEHTN